MEWVETTAKTVDEARNAALDQLGVAADEAEFDIVEEPRPGLFGRLRGEARVRARVKPATVRPKQDRRRRSRGEKRSGDGSGGGKASAPEPATDDDGVKESVESGERAGASADGPAGDGGNGSDGGGEAAVQDAPRSKKKSKRGGRSRTPGSARQEQSMNDDDERPASPVTPDEVGAAAVTFLEGLTRAFGHEDATTTLHVEDLELDVSVHGEELGLLVGPGGRTLTAIQDLARVASQRRLGDHDTRLRIDVAGYRERRQVALTRFAHDVAEQVRSSGTPRSLEPMTSADRKIIHDVLNDEAGVTSRSEGDDPDRRIVVEPV